MEIEQSKCLSCDLCIDNCPNGAIEIGKNGLLFINKDTCTECGACLDFDCPGEAIYE